MNAKALALMSTLLLNYPAFSCTDFNLIAEDHSVLVTRTMEFTMDLNSNLRSSNRGRQFKETTPDGKPAMSWTARYGYVFLDGINTDAALDGMNEKGLSVEALYLPGETQYQELSDNTSQAVPYIHFGDWVLSSFQTVEEVRAALSAITVFSTPLPGLGDAVFPLHFAIYDQAGNGLVVEFIKGEMKVHDNNLGVMTNSPTYDWHLVNLRNYVNLSPYTPDPVIDGSLIFAATGQGSGMKGLPGDVSPPSRFVKMSVLKKTAAPVKDSQTALVLAQHLINNVDIPLGLVRAKENGKETLEYTQWTVFKDLTNKIFYYRTYNDSSIRALDFAKIDLSEHAKRLKMSIQSPQSVVDVSKDFMQSS